MTNLLGMCQSLFILHHETLLFHTKQIQTQKERPRAVGLLNVCAMGLKWKQTRVRPVSLARTKALI